MKHAPVVWLTGLPSTGKSTVAQHLRSLLLAEDAAALVLDSDELREFLTPAPSYSQEERDWFYNSIGRFAQLVASSNVTCIIAATAPKREYRDAVRAVVGVFMEVLLTCDDSIVEARDGKGLYAKSNAGLIKNLPGRGAPYEAPRSPELVFDTGQLSAAAIAQTIQRTLKDLRRRSPHPQGSAGQVAPKLPR